MRRHDIIFIVIGVLLLTTVVFLPTEWMHTEPLRCAQNMAAINTFALVWADHDNNGNMPANFQSLSNEISSRRLICPGDWSRRPALDWRSFTASNASYVIVNPHASTTNDVPWLTCLIHTNFFVTSGGGMGGFDSNKYHLWSNFCRLIYDTR